MSAEAIAASAREAEAAAPRGGRWSVAEVLRAGCRILPRLRLGPFQWKVINAIIACGTGLLGARKLRCTSCEKVHWVPLSCGNRHCPRCQGALAKEWLAKQSEALLPVSYFHVVFTLPHAFNPLVRHNRALLYKGLMESAAETLLDFGHQGLGAQLGLTGVLHTWGQTLCEHYHVHFIVTGGGLSEDGLRWIDAPGCGPACKRKGKMKPFLFPVRALAKRYRGKYLRLLERLVETDELTLPERWGKDEAARLFYLKKLVKRAERRRWAVYSKRPFAGPREVLAYLSLYTHRVAISDGRIRTVDLKNATVSFDYKDYRQEGKKRVMTLELREFARRFALHILPPRFTKIRHWGILSTRNRARKGRRCQALLMLEGRTVETESAQSPSAGSQPEIADRREISPWVAKCPYCGSQELDEVEVVRSPVSLPLWVEPRLRGPPEGHAVALKNRSMK
jgi:hypothetical protein